MIEKLEMFDGFAPDGFMADGTPVYIQTNPGRIPSSPQLQLYAALTGASNDDIAKLMRFVKNKLGTEDIGAFISKGE